MTEVQKWEAVKLRKKAEHQTCFIYKVLSFLEQGKVLLKKLELGPQRVQELGWKRHSGWVSQVLGSCSQHAGAGVCCGTGPAAVGVCTCGTQTQGVSSWIQSTRAILGKADFSFCHKECDTRDSEDVGDDAEDN